MYKLIIAIFLLFCLTACGPKQQPTDSALENVSLSPYGFGLKVTYRF